MTARRFYQVRGIDIGCKLSGMIIRKDDQAWRDAASDTRSFVEDLRDGKEVEFIPVKIIEKQENKFRGIRD